MFVNYVVYGSRLSYSESDISSVTHVLGYNIVRFGSVLLTLLKMKNKRNFFFCITKKLTISLTPIASKTLESIILNMVNEKIEENNKRNQFGGMGGASTTDALVEMIHRWSEATDELDHYVRVALLDFSKAFDLINHNTTCEINTA